VIEAHVEYLGKARYDDLLKLTTRISLSGRARVRCDVEVEQAETGAPVCRGHTIHAVADRSGKPVRPPQWLVALTSPAG
jgi:acyl-CoA thioester hydrolase